MTNTFGHSTDKIFFAYEHHIDSLPLSFMLSKMFMMSKFWQVDGISTLKGPKFLLGIAFQNIKKSDDFELFPNLNSTCTSLGDVNWPFLATEKATKASFCRK